ncbi:unnamed protein product [Calicophoron daubneyi]|uniref:MOB kinase activator-like 2 n=1 Tax=Calicophoron daubneyi TaxID=300641 RepID=A0AAV2TRI9_CALDB
MDWLMGKARGVGKGLINAGNTTAAVSVADSNCVTVCGPCASPAITPVAAGSANDPEGKSLPIITREVITPNGQCSESPSGRIVSPNNNSAVPLQKCSALGKIMGPSKPSSDIPDVLPPEIPVFMQDKYLLRQLSLPNGLISSDFRELVEPFPEMDSNEWLAAHAISLFENLSTVFDAIHDLCACSQLFPQSASSASWHNPADLILPFPQEDDRSKKSKSNAGSNTQSGSPNAARQAIDIALSSCHDLIQSSRIFPVRNGEPFPPDIPNYVVLICKNLLICIIHIYLAHFHHLDHLDLVAHMNTLAKHFFAFTTRFSLVEERHFDPLCGLHRALLATNPVQSTSNPLTQCG